jgi:DNA-binding beta-propeller fold protein YncE
VMGGSNCDNAVEGADPTDGSGAGGSRRRTPAAPRRSIVALCLILGGLLFASAPALAAGDSEHALGKVITGQEKCAFTEPGRAAVSETTVDHEVYVYDRGANTLDRFNSAGECTLHKKVGKGETGEEGNEGLAVDNSPTSPSSGDIYVVNAEEKAILKFKPEGSTLKLVRKIKKFRKKEKEAEEIPEFEEMHGIAVDASGGLWLYEGERMILGYSNGEPNESLTMTEVGGECPGRPGFAVSGDAQFFYVGKERENHKGECQEATVLMKVTSTGEPATEPAFNAQLDNEDTTGVAVDSVTSEVYFDNRTNISAFNPAGLFIQRFGDEAGPGQLKEGAGLAVDASTDTVYAADASGSRLDVFVPKTSKAEPPEQRLELPDGRAFEMVSPQNKFGSQIYAISLFGGVVQASEDGNALTYTSSAPIVPNPPASRSPEPATSLSRRGSPAWGTESIATPRSEVPAGYASASGTEYEFFSSDLTTALVNPDLHGLTSPREPPLSPEASEGTPYWRSLTTPSAACEPTPSTCYQALVNPANDTAHSAFGDKATFTSATPDASHAVLKSTVALTPEAVEPDGLYEWGPGGALQLVSALPAGEEGTAAEAKLGGRGEQNGGVMRNAISKDGSRVIWSTPAGGGSTVAEKLYMRDMNKHETIRLDNAQGVAQPEEAGALFQTASADGSKIFFTDTQRLTPDSTIEPEFEELEGQGDLYVCEIGEAGGKPACTLKDLTAEVKAANENAAVQGVIGASDNGTYIYFVANGVLAADAGRGHCEQRERAEEQEEQEGKLPTVTCNLYAQHFNGGSWESPKFVAALTSKDAHDWHAVTEGGGALASLTSRVSPNGLYLSFMSDRSLTGYNNVDTHPEAKGARDEEVFLYKAESDRVLCASCNPTGGPPSGVFDTEQSGEGLGLLIDRPQNWENRWLAANIPGWTARSREAALYQSRYLSDTGRLFFNSADSLVPADTNGKADVYQYEPNGEGSCASATGCISLISSGTSKQESAFMDASLGGGDVFFLTSEKLVPQDVDSGFDVYDARVCTSSSPCLTPPAEPSAPCSGEGCKAPSSSQPALPSAPPSMLPGTGNVGSHEVLSETKKKGKPGLTNKQKLAKALKACKKIKKKSKRHTCERKAKKKYAPPKKAKK